MPTTSGNDILTLSEAVFSEGEFVLRGDGGRDTLDMSDEDGPVSLRFQNAEGIVTVGSAPYVSTANI